MPSGPISVHQIGPNDEYPKIKEYALTLKFQLQTYENLDGDKLAEVLQDVLRDWQDGRRHFDAEMMTAGLGRCLKQAVRYVLEAEAHEEFGHEMVISHDGQSRTARWFLEAEKRFADAKKPWINSEPSVKIT